jgi:hypothetical protein
MQASPQVTEENMSTGKELQLSLKLKLGAAGCDSDSLGRRAWHSSHSS